MTDLELDSIAEGLFKYILEQTDSPLDGISILGITLLKVFHAGTDGTTPIESLAEDFKLSLIDSYNTKSSPGPAGLQ